MVPRRSVKAQRDNQISTGGYFLNNAGSKVHSVSLNSWITLLQSVQLINLANIYCSTILGMLGVETNCENGIKKLNKYMAERKNVNKANKECEKAYKKRYTSFEEMMVVIEQAILCCGFVTRESNWGKYNWTIYNIQLLKNGFTPEDIGYPSDDEEWF
ncbi:hypothetical protein RIR_jg5194.t1 [Rhizophagus irregularis DAOM 181602=DAOM 197198]|nr:hypothetical protein RIR_jg5194.t1 [Rhizophagus irregularis DAOM 181602=DAOM 197198]